MIVRTLLDTFHGVDFGKQELQETRPIQGLKPGFRPAFNEDPGQLLANALPGNLCNAGGKLANGGERFIFNGEIQTGREAYRPDHPQPILFKTGPRITDGANQLAVEVPSSADE